MFRLRFHIFLSMVPIWGISFYGFCVGFNCLISSNAVLSVFSVIFHVPYRSFVIIKKGVIVCFVYIVSGEFFNIEFFFVVLLLSFGVSSLV